MSEEPQELQAEIDRLREHNDKLLAEKKKAVNESTKLQEQVDKLTAQIERRDAAPIEEVFEGLAAYDGFGTYVRNEFERSYHVGKTDDGDLEIRDPDGNAVQIDGEPARFTMPNVQRLVDDGNLPGLAALIKVGQNSGGGSNQARGATPSAEPKAKDEEKENLGFGLR